jgi:cytochrome P450
LSHAQTSPTQQDQQDQRATGDGELHRYFAPILAARHNQRGQDLISQLLDARVNDEGLTDRELLDICAFLVLAGIDPVATTMGCALIQLADHPGQRHRLATEDPWAVDAVTDELLRWVSPTALVCRVASKDTMIGDCPVKAGELVTVLLGAANTDPQLILNPGHVDLFRHPNPHLAFGEGIHRCLGEHLAKLQLRVALRLWHRRIPDYQLAPNTKLRYDFPLRTLQRLPLILGDAGLGQEVSGPPYRLSR